VDREESLHSCTRHSKLSRAHKRDQAYLLHEDVARRQQVYLVRARRQWALRLVEDGEVLLERCVDDAADALILQESGRLLALELLTPAGGVQ
jgi:hypothetical protein